MKQKQFSKKLLTLDYIITGILLSIFFVCAIVNGIYTMNITNKLIQIGMDISMIVITPPFNLDIFGVVLGIWIAQLGISSGAYYVLIKSERKIELPIKLLDTLPEDVKENLDLTNIITTVLTSTNN